MASTSTSNDIVVQSTSLYDTLDAAVTSLLSLQTTATQPLVDELSTATGLLQPSAPTYNRLSHFPDDLYDLSSTSHLTRFMKATLGDSGGGQLRKRQLVVRLQSAINSTSFYDLDSFYGALFGAKRGISGALPINPYTDLATPDGWDEISQQDAVFRERIIKLAKAITMGGTPQGLQAVAEALTGVDCDVYEIWALLDAQGGTGATHTWSAIEGAHSTWDSFAGQAWADVEGRIVFGQMGLDGRNEIAIRPKKSYSADTAGRQELAYDIYNISRVVNVLKPASAIVTVDPQGVQVHISQPIGAITADSDYWEISARVIPAEQDKKYYTDHYKAYDSQANPQGVDAAQPAPWFSSSQGTQYSYVGEIASVQGQGFVNYGITLEQMNDDLNHKPDNTRDYDTVVWPDKTQTVYRPEYAVIDPRQAAAALAASDGQTVAAPYSGPRQAVPTHG